LTGALERAQEVVNDQYVTIHELQLQLASVLEGIRILNERVEEYDKRIDGVQESTQKFFAEVQAENGRRNNVVIQTLDSMYDKIASEPPPKLDSPMSPTVGQFGSPHLGQVQGFPQNNTAGPINPNQLHQINMQLEKHTKFSLDLNARVHNLQQAFTTFQQQLLNNPIIPLQVQNFCDDVSSHLNRYQLAQNDILERLRLIDLSSSTVSIRIQNHINNSDNNFRETAMHMDSVKKRFAEHRKQLDNLITACRETITTTDSLNVKYESLRKFMGSSVVPALEKLQKGLPGLAEGNTGDTDGILAVIQNDAGPVAIRQIANKSPVDRRAMQDAGGDGGANNPIEL
jgi:chromosome segregation ATPase